MAASPENAEQALRSGAALLVYPGGDTRCTARAGRATVDFDGRKGCLRLALDDVPIVPVVSIGGQETALFLRAARACRAARPRPAAAAQGAADLDRVPWGLNVGDMLGHVPLPAKITVEALPPIHLREEFGPEPDLDEIYATRARSCRRRSTRSPPSAACR